MSKILLVMRHAKSSWTDETLSDHDRPLNPRGLRDAPRMAAWLDAQDSVPDLILCSTALRAHTTAQILERESSFSGPLLTYKKLYLGEPNAYLRLLAQLNDDVETGMVVGHNPGLEGLIQKICGVWEPMPTGAIAKIDLKIDRWLTAASVTDGELIGLWRPKEVLD